MKRHAKSLFLETKETTCLAKEPHESDRSTRKQLSLVSEKTALIAYLGRAKDAVDKTK